MTNETDKTKLLFIYIVMVVQTLIASGTHIVAKVVVEDIDSVTLTFLRSIVAASALTIMFLIKERRIRIERRDIPLMVLLGILVIPLNQFIFLTAIKLTTPSNAALFYATTPVFVMILSAVLLNERAKSLVKIGVIIGFLGIVLVIFERGIDFQSGYIRGNLLMIIAVVAWGFYTVLGRSLVIKYGSFHISSLSMIIGAILYFPIGITSALNFNYMSLTMQHVYGLLYLGIGTSVIAYFLWYYALGRIDSTRVAAFTYLQPVVTTILAVLLLNQIITVQFITGASIALIGVLMVQRPDFVKRKISRKEYPL